mmetsp:Transcript_33733/g.34361  ORF Transcript_33733/g.34361 Transcript_33733/m.34361 type:complete len:99 (-) Transcript_33733:67-363(-)
MYQKRNRIKDEKFQSFQMVRDNGGTRVGICATECMDSLEPFDGSKNESCHNSSIQSESQAEMRTRRRIPAGTELRSKWETQTEALGLEETQRGYHPSG